MEKDEIILQEIQYIHDETSNIHKRIDSLCDIVDKHDRHWSIMFFIGKAVAWVGATVTAIVAAVAQFFKG